MKPLTRDAAVVPAGEDQSTFLHDEMVHMIGNSIGILLTGITLTLGISSILLLSSKRPLPKQDKFLRAFTIVLLVLAVALQALTLLITFLLLLSPSYSPDKRSKDNMRLTMTSDMTLAIIAGLTDGLMVRTTSLYYS